MCGQVRSEGDTPLISPPLLSCTNGVKFEQQAQGCGMRTQILHGQSLGAQFLDFDAIAPNAVENLLHRKQHVGPPLKGPKKLFR
jgi:hypothetical protein